MNRRFYTTVRLVLAMATVLAWPAASFGQVKVMMSGGFTAFDDLRKEFEKSTGLTVSMDHRESYGNGPNTIAGQLAQGVPADVVIMARESLDPMIADGRVLAKSDADLAWSPLGLAVRAGAPKPDISTAAALKKTLQSAKCITFPNHTSGAYMKDKVFSQLGLAGISARVTNAAAASVASGDCEVAIQPVSELKFAKGVDLVGVLPADAQYLSIFSAGVLAASKQQEDGKKLIAFLTTENAKQAAIRHGLEPPKSR